MYDKTEHVDLGLFPVFFIFYYYFLEVINYRELKMILSRDQCVPGNKFDRFLQSPGEH